MPQVPRKAVINVFYGILEEVEAKLDQLPTVLEIFKIYEYLLVVFLIIRNDILDPETNPSDIFNPGFETISSLINMREPSEVAYLTIFVISMLFFVMIFVTQIRAENYKREMLSWGCVIIILFSRLNRLCFVNQAILSYMCDNSYYPILGDLKFLLGPFVVLYDLYMSIVFRKSYIYGLLQGFIFLSPILDASNYCMYIIISIGFLFYHIYEAESPNIWYHNGIMAVVVYQMLHKFTHSIQYSELIFCFLFVMICLANRFWKGTRIVLFENTQEQLEQYYDYIKSKKESAIRIEEEYLIESTIIEMVIKCHDNQAERLKPYLEFKSISEWNNHKHLQFLLAQSTEYYNEKEGKEAYICLAVFQLEIPENTYNTLLDISARFYKESIVKLHKYELYKLMAKIERYFRKYKTEISYLRESAKINKQVLKFYENLEALFGMFLKIWKALRREVIDFSSIEPLYAKAIRKYLELQRVLDTLEKDTKCNIEIYKFNQTSSLLQLKALSKLPTKSLLVEDLREDQQPFIMINQRKIVYCSCKFKNRFDYVDDDILGLDLDMILPDAFQQSFVNFSENDSNNHLKLQEKHSVIYNGKGCLEFVKVTPFLEPNFYEEITYVVFLSPLNNSHSPYILYSLDNDIIEEMSKGFLEQFNLESKDSHNVVTGKEAFEEYDFSLPKNRQMLENQEVAQTTISICQFKSTIADRFNKILVNIQLVHLFNIGGSVRMLLEIRVVINQNFKNIAPMLGLMLDGFIPPETAHILPAESKTKLTSNNEIEEEQKYMVQLLEKKQSFNRDKSGSFLIRTYWKTILRHLIYVSVLSVVCVLLYYSLAWYNYMMGHITYSNLKTYYLSELLFSTYEITHMKSWPPPQLTSLQISDSINSSYAVMDSSLQSLYQNMANTINELTLPFVNISLSRSVGVSIEGNKNVILGNIYSCFLIHTQNIVPETLDNFETLSQLQASSENIQSDFTIFKHWMDAAAIVCGLALLILIVLRVIQMHQDKISNRILSDTEILFTYLKNQEINVCVSAIEKTMVQQEKIDEVKMGRKTKEINAIQKDLKTIREIESYQTVQKKINHSIYFDIASLFRTLLYIVIICGFFGYLISFAMKLKTEIPNILSYENKIQLNYIKAKNSLVEVYRHLISKKIGKEVEDFQVENNYVTVMINEDNQLPPQFDNFKAQLWTLMNANICPIADPADLSTCKASILSKGISKSLDMFYQNVSSFNAVTIDDLYAGNSFQQVLFIRKYILKQMRIIMNLFMSYTNAYEQSRFKILAVIICVAVLIAIITGVIDWVDYRYEQSRNSICKSLFNLFPEELFMKPEIKAYNEEIKLTERLLEL